MKNILTPSLALLCLMLASPLSPVFAQSWSLKAGGNNFTTSPIINEMGNEICHDASGNLYSAGVYSGSMTLGTFSQTTNQNNMWVAKQNGSGTFLWSFAGPITTSGQSVNATSLCLDPSGDVIVAGQYVSNGATITGNGITLTASGTTTPNVYVMKINGSTGALVWCMQLLSGGGTAELNGVTTDASGNVYVAGSFLGTATISGGMTSFTNSSANGKDAFVMKLNGSGAYQWFQTVYDQNTLSGTVDNVVGHDIAADANGNIYLAGLGKCSGFVAGSISVASSSASSNDAFILKLDNTGTPLNIWSYGTTNSDGCYGIDISANGNLVVGGQRNNLAWIASVDPATGGLNYSLFPSGSSGSGVFYDVDTDANNNAYGIGFHNGTGFTYGSTTINTSTVDNLVAKVNNATSSFASAFTFGGSSTSITHAEFGRGITVLGPDEYVITGCFVGSTMSLFGTTLTANGNNDIYIARVCTGASIVQQPANVNACISGATPALSVVAGGSGLSYQWQSLSGATWSNVASGGTAASYTPTADGTYRVTLTGVCGNPVTSNSAVYTTIAAPTAAITGTSTICAGGSTTLIASGGGTYSWNSGTTTAAVIVTPPRQLLTP